MNSLTAIAHYLYYGRRRLTPDFKDSKALSIYDTDHSEDEDRWLTLGISEKGRLLVVAHTFREEGDDSVIIRIISSRKATKQELNTYGE